MNVATRRSDINADTATRSRPSKCGVLPQARQRVRFVYGEAYLRAADALIALARLEDAEEAVGHYLKVNSSSIEALVKLARVRTARGNATGASSARAEARDVWHVLHAFQRRKQLGWYLRARVGR